MPWHQLRTKKDQDGLLMPSVFGHRLRWPTYFPLVHTGAFKPKYVVLQILLPRHPSDLNRGQGKLPNTSPDVC